MDRSQLPFPCISQGQGGRRTEIEAETEKKWFAPHRVLVKFVFALRRAVKREGTVPCKALTSRAICSPTAHTSGSNQQSWGKNMEGSLR